jgi:HD-like signal output (HDOD) protein
VRRSTIEEILSDIAKIIQMIEPPASCSIKNSVLQLPSRVETISQAVTIVGTQQLSALALATSVMKMFKGLPEDLVSMDSFWRHSIACGLAARQLGTVRREANAERFFVAGMLHDIGRLVMFTKLTEASREILTVAKADKKLLYEIERERLGFTHAVVGGVLLQTWKLPTSLEETVMYHHNPTAAIRFPLEAAIVHVADIIVHAMDLGSSGETYVPPLDAEAWERLNLTPSVLASVEEQIDRQYQDALHTMLVDA